ncbi:MAG: tetratricopeptide repeat protein [Brevinemataceae bacterium]
MPDIQSLKDRLEELLVKSSESGDFSSAIDDLLKIAEQTKDNPIVCFYLGLLLVRIKNYQSGIRYLEIAKSGVLDPGQKLKCLIFLGKAYADVQAFSKAERAFREALQTGADEPAAYSALGVVFYERNMTQQAVDALKKALELDPKYASAINNLGYIFIDANQDIDQGLDLCRYAVELDSTNPVYRDSFAYALMTHGKYEAAKKELETALSLDPNNKLILSRMKELEKILGVK